MGKFIGDGAGDGHSDGTSDGDSDGPSTGVVRIAFGGRGMNLNLMIGFVNLWYVYIYILMFWSPHF